MNDAQPQFSLLSGERVAARLGELHTAHGVIETPAFWPVGTIAAVKLLTSQQLIATGAQGMLSNTYHLLLRPGVEGLQRMGGLHAWCGWNRPLLTDSGGFQVMSLAHRRKLTEEGVTFQSHIDGTKFHLSPEESIRVQRAIGADIIYMLDVCPAFEAPASETREAHERTIRWAARNRAAFDAERGWYGHEQSLWPVVQGGTDLALRAESAERLTPYGNMGFAIGGLAVGEPKELMFPAIAAVTNVLPNESAKHLLGVGTPDDLLTAIGLGVDTFDCVLPTRNARHGIAFTSQGPVRIKNEVHKFDDRALDPNCRCDCCLAHSRSFLRHLWFAAEANAGHWLTYHNLYYYHSLLADARRAIREGRYEMFVSDVRSGWSNGSGTTPNTTKGAME